MAKVPVCISIDPEVKAHAQTLFSDLGLDLSTAVNIFLKQSIRENGIPFVVKRDICDDEMSDGERTDDVALTSSEELKKQ